MATNITGVTMTQPLSDPNIQTGGSFTMGGQISTAGGGGWAESGDMYFEWDQGTYKKYFADMETRHDPRA